MSILKKLSSSREQAMNIIIVGAGKVGSTLADKLTAEGNNVTVVDKNSQLLSRVTTTYDIMGVKGNGSSYSTLIEAGIENADLIIAVTDSDELNLLCCTLAQNLGKCATIARVRTPDYGEELPYLRDKLGISLIINPELEAAREINRLLHFPSAISVNAFAKGFVDMITFKIPADSTLCGMQLSDLDAKSGKVLICAVERGKDLVIPNGSFVLAPGDIATFIARHEDAYTFFKQFGIRSRRISSAMLIGGGRTSFYLTNRLVKAGVDVKIIETDTERCNELAELLPDNVIIVNGDGTDESLLKQENMSSYDAIIPLTGIDEENILLTLYAMKTSPDIKTITKVNHIGFTNVIDGLDLGSVVYPRLMTAQIIRTYARARKNSIGSNIETLYRLFDDRAEAIEFKIDGSADYTGKPLKQLKLKNNLLIAAVIRGGRSFIPGGDDSILPGDTVIIVTTHSGFDNISDIFA